MSWHLRLKLMAIMKQLLADLELLNKSYNAANTFFAGITAEI
jgi:hypothetical protein